MDMAGAVRLIFLFLCFACLPSDKAFSSLVYCNRIATLDGYKKVEDLKSGDVVLSYDFNATTPERTIINTSIKKIKKHFSDSSYDAPAMRVA